MTTVAAVVTDGPGAVDVVRHALARAQREHLPLLLLVPLPRGGTSLDPRVRRRSARRRAVEAAAVLGRVAPLLALSPVAVTTRVVVHADRTGARRPVAVVDAVLAALRSSRVDVLVCPAALPLGRRAGVPSVLVPVPSPTARERTLR